MNFLLAVHYVTCSAVGVHSYFIFTGQTFVMLYTYAMSPCHYLPGASEINDFQECILEKNS